MALLLDVPPLIALRFASAGVARSPSSGCVCFFHGDKSSTTRVCSPHEAHRPLRARAPHRWLSPVPRTCTRSHDKLEVNSIDLWETGRAVYSVGLLLIGIIVVPIAVMFLRLLPQVLQVGRQLAEAITLHATSLKRDVDNDALLKQIAADVTTIKARVDAPKKAV